ncbi:nuclear transport factor 2 family protein [Mucilaginibacter terrae]|uniref:nuclear transport factor 2 family protein n=1 Tax=Mucilaginibacter terrae TaxID=1955052 RepID=UPI00363C3996
MKTTVCVILFSFIGIICIAQTKTEEEKIQATVTEFFDAISALNEAALKAEVTPDFTLVEHGLIWNADSLINNLRPMKGMNVKRINKLDFSKTEQQGNIAWVIYYNTADMRMNDKQRTIKWLESAVLVKQAGLWKIKFLHSTDLK